MIAKKNLTLLIAAILSSSSLFAQANPITLEPPASQPSLSNQFSYQGFAIDDTAMVGDPNRDAVREEVQKQLDDIVASGLSSEILSFFQSIPIQVIVPAASQNTLTSYDSISKKIFLTKNILPTNDTRQLVILRLMLKAFLYQKNPNGANNVNIASYFQWAQNVGIYDVLSTMMSSVDEFFIETSAAYLFGWNNSEPLSREKLKQNQPDYMAYLQKLFGPSSGSYNGSLAVSFSRDNGFFYNGFFIDDSALQDMPDREEMRAAVRNQIDVVENVGLPENIIAFFQTLSIKVVPEGGIASCGEYSENNNLIQLQKKGPVPFFWNHIPAPTLVHEPLHAYHHEVLPHGFNNSEILSFYHEAQTLMRPDHCPDYDPSSHMMSNVAEYFACSAATYLFGLRGDDPCNREWVQECQPDFVDYLHRLFGPNIGRYQPSIDSFLPTNFPTDKSTQ